MFEVLHRLVQRKEDNTHLKYDAKLENQVSVSIINQLTCRYASRNWRLCSMTFGFHLKTFFGGKYGMCIVFLSFKKGTLNTLIPYLV